MTQTDFVDGIIIGGTLFVSLWYLKVRYNTFRDSGESFKAFLVVVMEVLLADANIFEGTVAARVGAMHGAPWTSRIAMHLTLAGISAAAGLFLLNQVLEFITAFVRIAIQRGYNSIFNWLNFIKQGLDIVVVLVITGFGPVFNWVSIAYSNGDILINTQLLADTIFTFKGFFLFGFMDAFSLAGTMHTTTFNAGGATLAHLLILFGLASFFLDLESFKEKEPQPVNVGFPNVVNFFATNLNKFDAGVKSPFNNNSDIWNWVNKDKDIRQLILEDYFIEAKNYLDITKDLSKDRNSRKAAHEKLKDTMNRAYTEMTNTP